MRMNGSPPIVPEEDKQTSSVHVRDLSSRQDDSPLWDLTRRTAAKLAQLLAEVAKSILSGQFSQAQLGVAV